MTSKVNQWLAFLCCALFLFGCGDPEKISLEIDNPLDQALTVEIGPLTHTLKPNSSIQDSITVGEHQLKVKKEDGTVLKEQEVSIESEKGNALLNVGGIQYVTEFLYYSIAGGSGGLEDYTFKYGEEEFPGVRAELLGAPADLIHYGEWSYGISDTIPEYVSIYGDCAWVEKIWRVDDLLQGLRFVQQERLREQKEMDDLIRGNTDEVLKELDEFLKTWE